YKRGLGWYRLEFDNPGTGATQWLQFDGASIVADVWLNGQKLGQHKGAFTAFRFDVTGKLLTDQENVLLVKTDNRAPTANSDSTAIAPLSGDFNMSGGLYRSVSVVSTLDNVHFALNDLGSSGIFARTSALDAVAHNFGIRTMTFDPNLGFFLNGQSTPLRGVDMHQDYYHKAWAIDPANTDESFAIIDEIGANTLRLAHYPHAQYTLDHADA